MNDTPSHPTMSTPFVAKYCPTPNWVVDCPDVSRRASRAGGRPASRFGRWLKQQRLAFSKRNSYEEIERQLRAAGGHFVTSSTLQRYETEGRVPDVLTVKVLADLYGFDFSHAMLMLARELTGHGPTTVVPDTDGATGVNSAPTLSQAAVDAATISALKQKLLDLKTKYDELHDDVEGTIEHLSHHVGAKVTTAGAKEPASRRHGKKNAG